MSNFHTRTHLLQACRGAAPAFDPNVEITTQIKSCCEEQNKGTYLKNTVTTRKVPPLREEKSTAPTT